MMGILLCQKKGRIQFHQEKIVDVVLLVVKRGGSTGACVEVMPSLPRGGSEDLENIPTRATTRLQ
jgi:hypothetical protein